MNTLSLNSISLDCNIIRKGNGGGGNVSANSFARLAEIGYTNSEIKSVENQFYDDLEYSQALLDAWNANNEYAGYYYQRNCWVKHLPLIDTSNVTSMNGMFAGCTSLTRIASIDMSSVEDTEDIFSFCDALVFALIKNIGKSSATTFYFGGAKKWGTGSNENRQSLIDSLITYSYDRASNGLPSATIELSSTTKALLTEAEIAQITAKGFTISEY